MKRQQEEISVFGEGTDWTLSGKKAGGVNDAGEFGGVHTNQRNPKKALIKRDKHYEKNISEFLGSRIFAATNPGYGAEVFFTVPNKGGTRVGLQNDGSEVYVRSEFFGGTDSQGNKTTYSDMYVDMDANMSEGTKPNNLFRKEGRPVLMGSRNKLNRTLDKAFTELNYQGFDQIGPTSLLIGDFDMHTGNIGVVRDTNGENPKLVRIDFGGAFRNLTDDGGEIHPHSKMRHTGLIGKIATLGFGGGKPTNHFREFPRQLKLTHEFADGALKSANTDLTTEIDGSFAEMEKYYTPEAIAKWAQKSMPAKFKDIDLKDIPVESVKTSFKEVMRDRQNSLKEFALEIKLGLLFEKDAKGELVRQNKKCVMDKEALKELIQENPEYFKAIADGKKKVRLRDKKIRVGLFTGPEAEELIKKEVKNLIFVEQVLASTREATLVQPVTAKPKSPQIKGRALDTAVVRPRELLDAPLLQTSSQIINTVRTCVIDKQNKFLQANIALATKDPVVTKFIADLPPEAFRTYLRAEENHASIEEALKSPLLKGDSENALYDAEKAGYRELQDSFKGKITPLKWKDGVSSGQPSDQAVQIVEHEGVELCKLTQKTVKASSNPVVTTLDTGVAKNLVNYRSVDFPLKITDNTGPVHISLAVQDENGKNIPKRKAVYFTADYDESGKLMEVSCPVGVKFTDKTDNAVGYIERDGTIYTIPVNQGKYKAMMAEVARNQGLSANVSQVLEEEEAIDSVVKGMTAKQLGISEKSLEIPVNGLTRVQSETVLDRPSTNSSVTRDRALSESITELSPRSSIRSESISEVSNRSTSLGSESISELSPRSSMVTEIVPNKPYMDANGFSEGEDVGGVTGSKKVTKDGRTYQLKSSILDAGTKRRVLNSSLDHQNFGEVIAAKIGAAIMNKQGHPQLVPNLSLVYDEANKKCMVASEYLPNVDQGTLDDYAVKTKGVKKEKTFLSNVAYNIGLTDKPKFKKHIEKVTTRSNPKKYELSIAGDENALMRQDLANAIAISALTGDHDINPGNMIAIKGGRLARIDFGHAFNDLLNHSEAFGGQVRNEGNRILDFINRDEVSGGSSKLWRDYDIMPSKELANAFKNLSESGDLKKGIGDAKDSFQSLVTDLQRDTEGNKEVIKHVTDSLIYMSKAVKGEEIDPNATPQEILNKVFKNLENFCEENQKQMGDVSKLMQMQVDIDKLIQDKKSGKPLDADLVLRVKVQYRNLSKGEGEYSYGAKGIAIKDTGIEWGKLDKKTPPHKGDLDSYIEHRTKQLGLNKEFGSKLVENVRNSIVIKHTDNPRLNDGVKKEVAGIFPPVKELLHTVTGDKGVPRNRSQTTVESRRDR